MWRSTIARRGRLSIRSKLHSIQTSSPQVLHYPSQSFFILQPSFPSHFSANKKIPICQNPRFFSHYSPDPTIDDDNVVAESHFGSPISETNENFDAFIDRDSSVLEDNLISVLSESDSFTTESLVSGDDAKVVEEDDIYEIDFEKLESVLSLLQSSSSSTVYESLESSLDGMNLALHEDFVIRVLETPVVPGENLIGFFKWVLKMPEFSVTTRSVEALVRAISNGLKKKEAYALWDLIKEVGKKENGVLSTEILNELISLFSKLGKGKAGFEVFNKFGDFGCVADAETYYFTFEALCRRSIFVWACSVCEKMISAEKLPDGEKSGKVISYLCKGAKAKDAHLVYLVAKEKNLNLPRSSINFLISSLCQKDEDVCIALDMLEDFSGEERKYAIKSFSCVISGLCRIKDFEGAKNLLFKMIDAGPPPGNAVFNHIINGLSKAGDMEEARKMMKLMEIRGLKPDLYAYSVVMSGYAKGGEMEEACELLADAKKKHSKLSPVTYHTLIRGYCKLEEFEKALKLFGEMEEYGVQPNADEYNKLIQSLCLKAFDWRTAEKLLEKMKEKGLHLNGITKGLIKAVMEMEEEEVGSGEVTVGA